MSVIMMFSARSFAEPSSSAGEAVRGLVPLIGLDRTASPRLARNSSGENETAAPHGPVRQAARAGAIRSIPAANSSAGAATAGSSTRTQTFAW